MRAAVTDADLPRSVCPEVLQYIVNIDNRCTTRALQGKTPYEKLLGAKPDVSKINVCGSVRFVPVPKAKRQDKLRRNAKPALLLGLAQMTTSYRLLHLLTGNC